LALGKPIYVVEIDQEGNKIVVGSREHLYDSDFIVRDVNWIGCDKLEKPIKALTKIRQKHHAQMSTLRPVDQVTIHVTFDEPQASITPGQIAVFYQDDMVLGGGVISKNS